MKMKKMKTATRWTRTEKTFESVPILSSFVFILPDDPTLSDFFMSVNAVTDLKEGSVWVGYLLGRGSNAWSMLQL